MVLADRPTTSRWTPPRGERSYQVRPILEGKNRGRHFVRKTPSPGVRFLWSQTSIQPSTLTRTVARAGKPNSTPGFLCRLMCRWRGAVNDVNERVVWLPGAIVI